MGKRAAADDADHNLDDEDRMMNMTVVVVVMLEKMLRFSPGS